MLRLDPGTLCKKLSVMANIHNPGAREVATHRFPELPGPPALSKSRFIQKSEIMPQKIRWKTIVGDTWLQPLISTLTPYTWGNPFQILLSKKSLVSHYIEETENKTTPKKTVSTRQAIGTFSPSSFLSLLICLFAFPPTISHVSFYSSLVYVLRF